MALSRLLDADAPAVWCVGAAGLWNRASARPLVGLTAERKRPDLKGETDGLTALSRNGCILDARNTSGGVYPGGGVEE